MRNLKTLLTLFILLVSCVPSDYVNRRNKVNYGKLKNSAIIQMNKKVEKVLPKFVDIIERNGLVLNHKTPEPGIHEFEVKEPDGTIFFTFSNYSCFTYFHPNSTLVITVHMNMTKYHFLDERMTFTVQCVSNEPLVSCDMEKRIGEIVDSHMYLSKSGDEGFTYRASMIKTIQSTGSDITSYTLNDDWLFDYGTFNEYGVWVWDTKKLYYADKNVLEAILSAVDCDDFHKYY